MAGAVPQERHFQSGKCIINGDNMGYINIDALEITEDCCAQIMWTSVAVY